MLGRFKNAVFNAVTSSPAGAEDRVNGTASTSPGNSGSQAIQRVPFSSADTNRPHSRIAHGSASKFNSMGRSTSTGRPVKYEYSRPHFLNLATLDEIQVTADHTVRPIIVPRDLSNIPWSAGYAETINSGKSKRNEDQARVHSGVLRILLTESDGQNRGRNPQRSEVSTDYAEIPYRYFALFDGHAGPGAAVAAAKKLHLIIHERLMEIGHHLLNDGPFCDRVKGKDILWFPQTNVTNESLIIGALEASFHEMDGLIEEENRLYEGVNGGCTAVVCLFLLGKVYICNAGDSRAILCQRNHDAVALSDDFTPESERSRVRQLAHDHPSLLGGEFTSLEFIRRPMKKDIGSRMLYKNAYMTGWAYKVAVPDDLRIPVVFGQGKRSRVLGTIGVTRGFGDHELCAHNTSIRIKPFLSAHPEVRIVDLNHIEVGEDDVIVMGTDGLFDVTQNNTVANIVFGTVDQFPASDPSRFKYRYISAAQDLVMHARGKFIDRNWRMSDGTAATIDDISVFVIPILPYKLEHEAYLESKKKQAELDPSLVVENGEEAIGSLHGVHNGIGIFNEEETIEYEPKTRTSAGIDSKEQEHDNSEEDPNHPKQEGKVADATSSDVSDEAPASDAIVTNSPKNENEDDSSH